MSELPSTGSLTPREHTRLRRRQYAREALKGYLFLLPWLIGVLFFVAYPMLYSLFISFHKVKVATDGSGLDYDFIGFDNFKYAFLRDNVFPIELMLFMREVLVIVPITVIFALLVSLLLNQKFKGRMMFRTIFFLPVIFSTGQVLLSLFNQGQGSLPFGDQYDVTAIIYDVFPVSVGNTIMSVLGKFVIILWFSGVQVVIFLAAFQTISRSAYEAAQIDGVTPWESFWKITFPSIVPFIFLNLIYTLVEQSINPFNPILKHIIKNMGDYNTGFGYASAISWIYFLLILTPMVVLALLLRKRNPGKGA